LSPLRNDQLIEFGDVQRIPGPETGAPFVLDPVARLCASQASSERKRNGRVGVAEAELHVHAQSKAPVVEVVVRPGLQRRCCRPMPPSICVPMPLMS